MATTYLHRKYQRLNYSIDKINTVLYEFIDYLIHQQSNQLKTNDKKHEIAEIKKIVKDVVLRGIH